MEFENDDERELAEDLEPLDGRTGKVFFMDTKYDPQFKVEEMGMWQELKTYWKGFFGTWYDYVAVAAMVAYTDLAHAVDEVWKWIRDWILGGSILLIAVVGTLIWVGARNLCRYLVNGLAKRCGVEQFGYEDDDDF